jgi:dipeptidyl aminopeptidase/acylaminoacyl peptidase
MPHLLRAALLLSLGLSVAAQDAVLPTPETVKPDGVPPIPRALAESVGRYGEFRAATFLAWHPVERRMLIATAHGNMPQIHDVAGPGATRTPVTSFSDGVTGEASYEPRGRYFVFAKDTGGGSGTMQLFRYDPAARTSTLLTDGKSRYGDARWSHKTGRIAYYSTQRDGRNRDLYVMDPLDPASERRVAEVEGPWLVMDWSPDDLELLAFEGTSIGLGYLWRIDVATGARHAVSDRKAPPVRMPAARYTHDGRNILALTDNGEELMRLWSRPVGNGSWRPVTGDGQAVEAFAPSPTGSIAIVFDRAASSQLEILDTSGRGRRVDLPPGVVSRLAWRPDGAELAFTLAGAHTAGDVYSWTASRGTVERWTTSEVGGANPEALPAAEIIEWKSFDGRAISGVMYRPAATFKGRRPVIINVHGGPQERERPRFLGRSNYFRNEMGIAVIYPNIRGSVGFGRTFEQLDDQRKREDAIKDIGALLDWIAAQPDLDKDRVMITGASYGGYVALAAAIAYGDRLRCAFEGFGISDFVSYLESTEESRRHERRLEYGNPADPEMREFLKSISPLTHAAKIRIPLFIAQGAKDSSIPIAQSEQLVQAIRKHDTPLWYVVYTDSGHGFTRTSNDYNIYAWVMFVQKYLLN